MDEEPDLLDDEHQAVWASDYDRMRAVEDEMLYGEAYVHEGADGLLRYVGDRVVED